VWFVGKIGDEQKLIAELGLEDVVKQTAYVPHRRSIAYLKGADLLLLVGGKRDWEETGKIYEYFAAGKPILGLVKRQGAAASLLQQYAAAHIVDKDDISETCNALGDLISGSERLNVPVDRAWVRQFERQQLTGKLAQVFNQVVNEAHLPSPV
jgi:glycosyltransferase involved in cell wall biosynthesis